MFYSTARKIYVFIKTDFLEIDLIPKQFELLVPDWLEIEETNYLLYLLLEPFRNKSNSKKKLLSFFCF